MNEDLRVMYTQLAVWAEVLNNMCKRHMDGRPAPAPDDLVLPHDHIPRLVDEIGEIYCDIVEAETPSNCTCCKKIAPLTDGECPNCCH